MDSKYTNYYNCYWEFFINTKVEVTIDSIDSKMTDYFNCYWGFIQEIKDFYLLSFNYIITITKIINWDFIVEFR